MLKLLIVVTSVTLCIPILYVVQYRSVDSMYIHTELDTHKGVHRLLRRVYKEPVNTLNNRYFHTYLKLHTVRPSLSNKVQSKLQ